MAQFRRSLRVFLNNIIADGKKKLIIYPFGKVGQQLKNLLDESNYIFY